MLRSEWVRKSLNFKSLFKLFISFPQYLIAPCFIPVMFEGITTNDREQRACSFKIKVWKNIISSYLKSLYESMPLRMMAVMNANGGHTKYWVIFCNNFVIFMNKIYIISKCRCKKTSFPASKSALNFRIWLCFWEEPAKNTIIISKIRRETTIG